MVARGEGTHPGSLDWWRVMGWPVVGGRVVGGG